MSCVDVINEFNLLIWKKFRVFLANKIANYECYYRGERQFKPPNQFSQFQFENSNCQTETSSSSVPVGKPKRKPRIEPGSSRFGSLVRLKPYWVGISDVPIRNIGIGHGQQLRDFGDLEMPKYPPLTLSGGGVCA
jgi:hypothetical protein